MDGSNICRGRCLPYVQQLCRYALGKQMSSGVLYMKLSPRTAQVNLRISPELKEAAEKAAESDHRSLTSLIEVLLMQHINGKAKKR